MRLENTRFIGWASSGRARLPFDELLAQYAVLRDATANLVHGEHDVTAELWPFIVIASFSYAFNVYKAIGLISPELYHESGAVLLRQLWEVSLNLHWIERDPVDRAPAFSNYTIMEVRKFMQKTGEIGPLRDFDEATTRFQARFRHKDHRNRDRCRSNFAASTVEQRANELGDPWKNDYKLLYCLASMHAHGAPGAVGFPFRRMIGWLTWTTPAKKSIASFDAIHPRRRSASSAQSQARGITPTRGAARLIWGIGAIALTRPSFFTPAAPPSSSLIASNDASDSSDDQALGGAGRMRDYGGERKIPSVGGIKFAG